MKLPFPDYNYCIDTSALIDLKETYSRDVFPSVWADVEKFISQGRFIAPLEVLNELQQKDDELLKWAQNHRKMFKDLDNEQQQHVRDILNDFPKLVDPSKMVPDADPFIISLAMSEGCIVITSEKMSAPGSRKTGIPNACQKFNIKCVSLREFFREQKWTY